MSSLSIPLGRAEQIKKLHGNVGAMQFFKKVKKEEMMLI